MAAAHGPPAARLDPRRDRPRPDRPPPRRHRRRDGHARSGERPEPVAGRCEHAPGDPGRAARGSGLRRLPRAGQRREREAARRRRLRGDEARRLLRQCRARRAGRRRRPPRRPGLGTPGRLRARCRPCPRPDAHLGAGPPSARAGDAAHGRPDAAGDRAPGDGDRGPARGPAEGRAAAGRGQREPTHAAGERTSRDERGRAPAARRLRLPHACLRGPLPPRPDRHLQAAARARRRLSRGAAGARPEPGSSSSSRPATPSTTAARSKRWPRSGRRRARIVVVAPGTGEAELAQPRRARRARHPLHDAARRRARLGRARGDRRRGSSRSAGTSTCSSTAATCRRAKRSLLAAVRPAGDRPHRQVPRPDDDRERRLRLALPPARPRPLLDQAVGAVRELESGPPDYADIAPLVEALAARYPERCLWASNWPHPNTRPLPSEQALLEWTDRCIASAATRQKILVDNPASLYRF